MTPQQPERVTRYKTIPTTTSDRTDQQPEVESASAFLERICQLSVKKMDMALESRDATIVARERERAAKVADSFVCEVLGTLSGQQRTTALEIAAAIRKEG